MKLAQTVPVYQGRLMSPNDVRTAMHQRGDALPPRYQKSWYLCGDVTDEFFSRVASARKIEHSLNIFTVNGNTSYAVFGLQIREHQARFLLPFASEKSVRFIEQVERTGVCLSLGKAGKREAILLEFHAQDGQLKELRDAGKRCAGLPCDLELIELRMATFAMTEVSCIPDGTGAGVVSEVCLTVILDD
jgi:hypothetical protein